MAVDDEAAQLAAAAALPLRERAKHKNWKARVAAFEDIATSSAAGGGADDEAGPFLKGEQRQRLFFVLSLAFFSFQFWRGGGDRRGAAQRAASRKDARWRAAEEKSAPLFESKGRMQVSSFA